MNKPDPLKTYRETQIKTAAQGKLILMLYDGAIKNINLAQDALKEKHRKYDRISGYIIKVQDIITEFIVSLDFDKGGEIAKSLFSLYMYMNRQLLEANIQKDGKHLVEVKKLISELRSAWAEIADKKGLEGSSERTGGINIAG